MTDRADDIVRPCTACGYDLRGSAEGSVCPECGFPKVDDAIEFHEIPQAPSWILWTIMLLAAAGRIHRPLRFDRLYWLAIVTLIVVGLILEARRRRGPGVARAIVSTSGVVLLDPQLDWLFLDWNSIGGAARSWWSGDVTITDRAGNELGAREASMLGGRRKSREFAAMVNARGKPRQDIELPG
jgi:hypothetical protein